MKAFITGISGLLGANLAKTLPASTQILGTYNTHPVEFNQPNINTIKLDLTNLQETENAIAQFQPDVIIHCAAITNVDWCETNKEATTKAHVEVTEHLAKIAKRLRSKFVYISTDSVFDGAKGNYSEQDTPNPVNFYARTKLQGEEAARMNPDTIIIRTNMYGWNAQDKKSLAEWVLANLQDKKPMDGFTDIIFSPMLVNRISRSIQYLLDKNFTGTINLNSTDALNKYEFACRVAETFGHPKTNITPKTSDGVFKVPRPKNTTLNTSIAKQLGVPLATIREDLLEMKQLLDNGYVAELKKCKTH